MGALLYGGSRVVQDAFMAYFESTKEETFFHCIQRRFAISTAARKERRVLTALTSSIAQKQASQLGQLLKRSPSVASGRSSKLSFSQEGIKSALASLNPFRKRSTNRATNRPSSPPSNRIAPQPPRIEIVELEEVRTESHGTADDLPLINSDGMEELKPKTGLLKPSKTSKADAEGLKAAFSKGPAVADLRDSGEIDLVVEMLGLLCDGQNGRTQDYLREQRDNIKSVNLVAECAKYLDLLYAQYEHCRYSI